MSYMSSDHHYEDRCIVLMPNQSRMGQRRNSGIDRLGPSIYSDSKSSRGWTDHIISYLNFHYKSGWIYQETKHLSDMSGGGDRVRRPCD